MERIEIIKQKYSFELNEIENRLRDLENGRIMEFTGAKMDGHLSTNIQKLRKDIYNLIGKIAINADSIDDKIAKTFEK